MQGGRLGMQRIRILWGCKSDEDSARRAARQAHPRAISAPIPRNDNTSTAARSKTAILNVWPSLLFARFIDCIVLWIDIYFGTLSCMRYFQLFMSMLRYLYCKFCACGVECCSLCRRTFCWINGVFFVAMKYGSGRSHLMVRRWNLKRIWFRLRRFSLR